MGEREHRFGSTANRSGNAGDNLRVDTARAAGFDFLAATPENERIATLEPHDQMPGLRLFNEDGIDLFLRHRMAAALLGDRNHPRGGIGQPQHCRIDQPVMHDNISAGERIRRLKRQKARIAGSGSDEQNPALGMGKGIFHAVQMERSARKDKPVFVAGALVQLVAKSLNPMPIAARA